VLEPHHFAKNIFELGLPDMVNGMVSSEVKQRLDEEFYMGFEQESERKALEKQASSQQSLKYMKKLSGICQMTFFEGRNPYGPILRSMKTLE